MSSAPLVASGIWLREGAGRCAARSTRGVDSAHDLHAILSYRKSISTVRLGQETSSSLSIALSARKQSHRVPVLGEIASSERACVPPFTLL